MAVDLYLPSLEEMSYRVRVEFHSDAMWEAMTGFARSDALPGFVTWHIDHWELVAHNRDVAQFYFTDAIAATAFALSFADRVTG